MNEKIKELAEQAGLYDFVIEAMGIDSEMQQFAEMIVKECAKVANAGIDPDEDYLVGDDILQHFGVEE